MTKQTYIRRLAIALLTFIIGSGITLLWITYRQSPLEKPKPLPDCLTDYELPNAVRQSDPGSYFPPEAFAADHDLGRLKAERYPKNLLKMDEPSFLSLPECVDEIYRFLWLRAFHPPIAVRVWQSGRSLFLVAKQLDEHGKLTVTKSRFLGENEWLTFKNLLDRASFWEIPTVGGTLYGNDGAQWILEGAKKTQYHIVDRWSPENKDYRAACVYLMTISGLEIDSSLYEAY